MPSDSIIGKDGTLFKIDTYDYLASFTGVTIEFTTDNVEHTAVKDDVKHYSNTHIGWTASGTNLVRSGSAWLLRAQWQINESTIALSANIFDGGSFVGNGYLTTVGVSAGDDPNEESWSFQGTGDWTMT